jgi:hypothetical protein
LRACALFRPPHHRAGGGAQLQDARLERRWSARLRTLHPARSLACSLFPESAPLPPTRAYPLPLRHSSLGLRPFAGYHHHNTGRVQGDDARVDRCDLSVRAQTDIGRCKHPYNTCTAR